MSGDDQSVSLSIDDDFQKFLDEPLSSDDSEHVTSKTPKQKLWWLEGEDDEPNEKTKDLSKNVPKTWLKKKSEYPKLDEGFNTNKHTQQAEAGEHSCLKESTERCKEDEKDSVAGEHQSESELLSPRSLAEKKSEEMHIPKQDLELQDVVKEDSVSVADDMSLATSQHSEKEIQISDEQLKLSQSLVEDNYSEDTFNTSASKAEILDDPKTSSNTSILKTHKHSNEEITSDKNNKIIASSKLDEKSIGNEEKEGNTSELSKSEELASSDDKTCQNIENVDDSENKETQNSKETEVSKESGKGSFGKEPNSLDLTVAQGKLSEKTTDGHNDHKRALDREEDLLRKLLECQEMYKGEQRKNSKLKAELMDAEEKTGQKLQEQRLQLEGKIYNLQQETIILSARLEEREELYQSKSTMKSSCDEDVPSLKQHVYQLEKELKDQEHLLQGYQKENEHLYSELKMVQKQSKLKEGKLINQNERLSNELARTKEQLYLKERAQNFKLDIAKEYEINTDETLAPSNQSTKNMPPEVKVEMEEKVREMEKLKETLLRKQEETEKLREEKETLTHKVEELVKKLPANNTKDILTKKEEEIHKLIDHIKELEKERIAEKKLHQQSQLKNSKRIKELENQLQDVEESVQIREAELINKNGHNDRKTSEIVKSLENQIRKLQQELEAKDQSAKQNLQQLEQQYRDIKLGYEKRMKNLESQYQEQTTLLKKQLSEWEDMMKQTSHSPGGRSQISFKVLPKLSQGSQCSLIDIKRWDNFAMENKKLTAKNENLRMEITELKTEYRRSIETAKQEVTTIQLEAQEKISEMRSEMEELRLEQERSELAAKALIKNAQKEVQEMTQQLKILRRKELQQAWNDFPPPVSLQPNNHAKIADLMNKLEVKDIIISQLKERIHEYEQEQEKIKILEMKNSVLQDQIKDLNIALKEIQSHQTPQEKEYWALKEEIKELEKRHFDREEIIHKLIYKLRQKDSKYLKNEIAKWQQCVVDKNKEIEHFRDELDVILRYLEELKQLGVVVPRPKSAT